jgi:hypothetical protein
VDENLHRLFDKLISGKIKYNFRQYLSNSSGGKCDRNEKGIMKWKNPKKTNKENKNQSSNLWIGLIFIFGGVAVLLNQFDLLPFELNWWALFIIMPAAGFMSGAYNRFRANEDLFSMEVAFPALIGLFLTALSFSLLVGAAWNINWSLLWPVIIILVGLSMIFGRSQKE